MDERHQLVRHQGPGEPARVLSGKDVGRRGYSKTARASSTGAASRTTRTAARRVACTFTWYDEKGNPVESDIRFNTAYKWSTTGAAGALDIQSIAAHEIGHVLQFDHVTNASKDDETNVMWPYFATGNTTGRKLGRGDALEDNSHY